MSELVLGPKWGVLRGPSALGLVGNGVMSDRLALQALIDWSAAARRTITIPDGRYWLDGPLYARDYATIVCEPNAVFVRGFTQSGTSGLLMNQTMTTQVRRFRWTGGVIENAGTLVRDGSQPYSPGVFTGGSLDGNSVCLYGDAETEITDLFCDEWAARPFLLFGDIKMRRCRAISYQDGGGIRYAGWGREFRAIDCHVVCGDDALQFVPPGATGAVGFNQATIGGQFIGCTGLSWNARFMAAVLLTTAETLNMTNDIRDCGWMGCHGRGLRALTIENEDSTGIIAGVGVTDCSVEIISSSTLFAAVNLTAAVGSGGVEDVTLRGLRIRSPVREALKIDAADVRRVRAVDCVFGKPTTAGVNCVQVDKASDVTFSRSRLTGNGTDVALVGSGSNTAYGVDFDDCRFDEIDNLVAGVRFNACIGGLVRRATFVQRSGQTTARGVAMGAATGVQQIVLEGPHDNTGLTLAEYLNPFTNNGSSGNRIASAAAIIVAASARTMRNHESGSVVYNTGATSLVACTLPSAVPNLVYSACVTDADGIRFQAGAGDRIRYGATLGAAAGSITSTTIGDTITLRCVVAGEWLVMPAAGAWTVA